MVGRLLKLLLFGGLALASHAWAIETLLLGGSGDPKGETTIFDDSIKELAKHKDPLNLHLEASFDGGHSATESILTNELKVQSEEFTRKSFQGRIDEYVEKINSGEIASGQQLLVIVDTHGASPSGATHPISTNEKPVKDYDHFVDESSVSMDAMAALTQAAKEKHIKLAIVDMSCHSGASLALANENTCVISASSSDLYAYSNFPELFFQEMKKGDNLENIFLRARKKQTLPSFPMISTQAGIKTNDDLLNLIEPYLRYTGDLPNMAVDSLSPYLKSLVDSHGFCKREQDFDQLLNQIRAYQEITHQLALKSPAGTDLLAELQDYKKIQDDLAKEIQSQGYGLLKNTEVITYGPPTKDKSGKMVMKTDTVDWRSILNGYPLSNITYCEDQIAKQKVSKKPDLQQIAEDYGIIEKFRQIDVVREKIKAQYPNILVSQDIGKKLLEKSALLQAKAIIISNLANMLYDSEYQSRRKTQSNQPEACRDFTF